MPDVATNPPGLVGGSAALAHAGWTTQFQRMPDVLYRGEPLVQIAGLRAHRRDPARYDVLAGWLSDTRSADWGLQVLDPVMAIADAWMDQGRGTHMYDPDDLDFDEIGASGFQRLPEALAALGAAPSDIAHCLDHYTSPRAAGGPGFGRRP